MFFGGKVESRLEKKGKVREKEWHQREKVEQSQRHTRNRLVRRGRGKKLHQNASQQRSEREETGMKVNVVEEGKGGCDEGCKKMEERRQRERQRQKGKRRKGRKGWRETNRKERCDEGRTSQIEK